MQALSMEQITASLDQNVQETFESLFFMEAPQVDIANLQKLVGVEGLEVNIEVKSGVACQIKMLLSAESAYHLAASMPNNGLPATPEMISDIFSEMVNTISGRVAASLVQSEFSFDLSIPTVTLGKLAISEMKIQRCYQVDYGLIGVCCHLEAA